MAMRSLLPDPSTVVTHPKDPCSPSSDPLWSAQQRLAQPETKMEPSSRQQSFSDFDKDLEALHFGDQLSLRDHLVSRRNSSFSVSTDNSSASSESDVNLPSHSAYRRLQKTLDHIEPRGYQIRTDPYPTPRGSPERHPPVPMSVGPERHRRRSRAPKARRSSSQKATKENEVKNMREQLARRGHSYHLSVKQRILMGINPKFPEEALRADGQQGWKELNSHNISKKIQNPFTYNKDHLDGSTISVLRHEMMLFDMYHKLLNRLGAGKIAGLIEYCTSKRGTVYFEEAWRVLNAEFERSAARPSL